MAVTEVRMVKYQSRSVRSLLILHHHIKEAEKKQTYQSLWIADHANVDIRYERQQWRHLQALSELSRSFFQVYRAIHLMEDIHGQPMVPVLQKLQTSGLQKN